MFIKRNRCSNLFLKQNLRKCAAENGIILVRELLESASVTKHFDDGKCLNFPLQTSQIGSTDAAFILKEAVSGNYEESRISNKGIDPAESTIPSTTVTSHHISESEYDVGSFKIENNQVAGIVDFGHVADENKIDDIIENSLHSIDEPSVDTFSRNLKNSNPNIDMNHIYDLNESAKNIPLSANISIFDKGKDSENPKIGLNPISKNYMPPLSIEAGVTAISVSNSLDRKLLMSVDEDLATFSARAYEVD
jgi:hypothetical protein